MEAPNRPNPVAPIAAFAHHSRLGPVVGGGKGVFHLACTGKYIHFSGNSCPDAASNFSAFDKADLFPSAPWNPPTVHSGPGGHFSVAAHASSPISGPGRIIASTMEVLDLSNPVLPNAASAHHSRPGPVVGCRERVFQPASSGKYDANERFIPPDASLSSSSTGCNFPLTMIGPTSVNKPDGNDETALRIYYQNVRGLRTKVDGFFLAASESDYDVVVLTETWLDDRIFSAQLFGDAFSVYRTDRNGSNSRKTRGGGVLIAVATRWNSCVDSTPIGDSLEQIWIRVTMPSRIVSVGVIYLPPDRRSDIVSIQDHLNSIGAITGNLGFNDYALQFGDYNQSALRWRTLDDGSMQVEPQTVLSAASSTLIDGFSLHGLKQLNGVLNRNTRLLDLVLSNEAAASVSAVSEAIEPLSPLDHDHPALDVLVKLPAPIAFEERPGDTRAFDFRRADYAGLSAAISLVDWRPIDSAGCVDDAVQYFNQTICNIIAEFVPLSRPTPKPPWSNGHLRRLKRYRAKALRRYCRNRSYITKQEFNRTSNDYRRYNRFLYRRYVLRTQASLRTNPKRFWSFVNSKKKEIGLPMSIHLGEQIASTEQEKCHLFAQHFQSSFNGTSASSNQVGIATSDTPRDAFDFQPFHISEHMIELALRKVKLSYVAGPDGIPASIIKLCSESLLVPLAKLFNSSLQESKFPEAWKFSFMFPVHKKGDKRNIQNYRGITSLCCCSKVFEIIINDALFSSCKNYISTSQHGFYPKRSVMTNLTEFVSLCVRTMDSGGQVDAVYTDLKAAFDRVDHRILLGKLEILGASSSMVSWFASYLTDRSLCVRIGDSQSEIYTNISGVPQGSNLGPLLFSLFINELSRILPPGFRLFYADDVKMYMVINNIADCENLQLIVNHMQSWCSHNNLTLSINKCNVISFHRRLKPIIYDYSISGQTLERLSQVRDLGVTLDCALTFKPHYNDVLNKANRQLGFMFKISEDFRDPLCLRALYCSLVRSILEFSSVVWCPYQACWIARFESVQKKFVRYALRYLPWRDTANLPSYVDRCRLLGIDTLEVRRRNAQAVFVAKIVTGEIDSPALLRQLNFYAPERVMRQRNFVHLAARNRQYGMNEPIRAMAIAFNEAYECFDFNIPLHVFIRRLT